MTVYRIEVPNGGEATERLVEAPNQASARNHVARSLFKVEPAKSADLFRLAKAGIELETAGASADGPAQAEANERSEKPLVIDGEK